MNCDPGKPDGVFDEKVKQSNSASNLPCKSEYRFVQSGVNLVAH